MEPAIHPDEQLLLVYKCVSTYRRRGEEFDELASVAWLAMQDALKPGLFDPARGTRIETYCWTAMLNAIRSRRKQDRRFRQYYEVSACLFSELEAVYSGLSDAAKHRSIIDVILSVDDDPAGLEPGDLAEPPWMKEIPERYASVLRKRAGIGCEPMLLAEIGAELGVTKERVRQLEAKAIAIASEHIGITRRRARRTPMKNRQHAATQP